MKQIDPSVKKIWMVQYAILSFILVTIVLLRDVTKLFADTDTASLPFGVIPAAILIVCVGWMVYVPRLRYRFWKYELRDEEIEIVRGAWTRVTTLVPLRRIQHLDVSQNIFEREFDLSRLVIYTAGTQSNRVVLLGLPKEEAEELRDTMKRFVLEEPGQ